MLRPTPRDLRVVRAVAERQSTVRELCSALGYRSPGTASKALARLLKGGLLERVEGARSRVYKPTMRASRLLEQAGA